MYQAGSQDCDPALYQHRGDIFHAGVLEDTAIDRNGRTLAVRQDVAFMLKTSCDATLE